MIHWHQHSSTCWERRSRPGDVFWFRARAKEQIRPNATLWYQWVLEHVELRKKNPRLAILWKTMMNRTDPDTKRAWDAVKDAPTSIESIETWRCVAAQWNYHEQADPVDMPADDPEEETKDAIKDCIKKRTSSKRAPEKIEIPKDPQKPKTGKVHDPV